MTFLSRLGSNTFLQFLLLARSCGAECSPVSIIRQAELEKMEMEEAVGEGLTRVQLLAQLQEPEPEWEEKVAKRLTYEYPYGDEVAMKTKVTVSELKHRAMDRVMQEEAGPAYQETVEEVQQYVPAFMEGVQEVNIGARRGTAMHRILECYDFTKEPDTLEVQLRELEGQKRIEKEKSEWAYL